MKPTLAEPFCTWKPNTFEAIEASARVGERWR